MRFVSLDPFEGPPLVRTTAACLATILEAPPGDVPTPESPEPWTVWRNWLGQRGLGLVAVPEPHGFAWPGPWLALLGAPDDRDTTAAIAFGAPPGLLWQPISLERTFEDVRAGYVIAPLDVALWSPSVREADRRTGRVEALVIAADAGADVRVVQQARARAGRGLDGDRYAAGRGTFSNPHARGVDLTLIEAEALEALRGEGIFLAPQDARRNVVTRGIDLNALVGERFRIGEVECLGQRLCEPCAHLGRLTQPATLRGLVHRGGLRADVLTNGVVGVGDVVSR